MSLVAHERLQNRMERIILPLGLRLENTFLQNSQTPVAETVCEIEKH